MINQESLHKPTISRKRWVRLQKLKDNIKKRERIFEQCKLLVYQQTETKTWPWVYTFKQVNWNNNKQQ